MSVVQKEKSKACDCSSPGTTAGIGVQHTDSTTTIEYQGPVLAKAVDRSSEQERGGESERAPMRSDKSSAGAASAEFGAKQQVYVSSRERKACNTFQTMEAEQAGSRYPCLSNFRGLCFNCSDRHHNHECLLDCVKCGDGPPCQCKCWR